MGLINNHMLGWPVNEVIAIPLSVFPVFSAGIFMLCRLGLSPPSFLKSYKKRFQNIIGCIRPCAGNLNES
jgi:hypothetical protein